MPGRNCRCGDENHRAQAVHRPNPEPAAFVTAARAFAEAAGRLSVASPDLLQALFADRRNLRERFQAGVGAEMTAQLFKFERDLTVRKLELPMSMGTAGGAYRILAPVSARDFIFDQPESPIVMELVHERLRRQAQKLGANAIINVSYRFGPADRVNKPEADALIARVTDFIQEVSDVPPAVVKEIITRPTRRASAIGTAVQLVPNVINGVVYEVCSPAQAELR